MKRKVKLSFPVLFSLFSSLIIGYTTILTFIHGGLYDIFMGTILTELFSMSMFALCLTVYKYKNISLAKKVFSFFLFLLTFSIQTGSAISYPFQAYRSGWPDEQISMRQNKFLTQIIIFFVVFFVGALFIMKIEEYVEKKIKIVILVPIIVNFTVGIYFLITPGKSANIQGIMIGLPLISWMIFSFSVYEFFYRYTVLNPMMRIRRFLSFSLIITSSCILILGYVHRHEYGIPAFFIIACFMWIFLEPHYLIKTKKQKLIFYGTSVTVILAGIVILATSYMIYKSAYNTAMSKAIISENGIEEAVSNLSVFHNLGSKVGRILLNTGTKFSSTAGVWGTPNFVYDFAANNDYSLALQIHNFGIVWLIIINILLILTTLSGCIFLSTTKRPKTIFDTARSVSFFSIIVLTVYPLLSNIGVFPIVGVSAYASGYSIMNSVLAALLLAFTVYERR